MAKIYDFKAQTSKGKRRGRSNALLVVRPSNQGHSVL